ncbi:MAG: GNAT family N-acetyltransferase [Acidimicrobiales bacterium]
MPATTTVRPATAEDASALGRLRFRWRVAEQGELGLGEAGFITALGAWMGDHSDSHLAFLAEDDADPVGMAWLAIVDRIPGPETFLRRSAYVQSVYVVPEQRSQGVGARLVVAALDHSRSLGCAYVAVHHTERSTTLYRRLGFTDPAGVLEIRL